MHRLGSTAPLLILALPLGVPACALVAGMGDLPYPEDSGADGAGADGRLRDGAAVEARTDTGQGFHDTGAESLTSDAGADAVSSGDESAESSAEVDALPGQPITAPERTWTWVPFPNAFCGNGTATGIGVNIARGSTRVLLYLGEGGACWSDTTCFTLQTAVNLSGYSGSKFATESRDANYLAQAGGFFDRTAASNAFKDYSYVYVPYCTGDMHAGNNVTTYASGTVHHVGFANMSAFLARIVPTFPAIDRVILAGSSEGGLGAAFNWWQTQQAFGSVRVDVIDDSGTFMPPDIEAIGIGESAVRTQWNLAATLPSGCTACATRLDALYGFYGTTATGHRGALLSYVEDTTQPQVYGITTAQFSQGLQEELATYGAPGLRAFMPNAPGHVLWFNPTLAVSGVTVQEFITKMVTDDPSWASVQ
jgi:hypothetical protein